MSVIRFAEYCCQGGDKVIDPQRFDEGDLVITERGKNTLVFSPLGNRPVDPVVALVGITPGSQSEEFARLIRDHPVEVAASKAAFAKGQGAIKELLRAHGFAKYAGLDLTGDLNENPKIFTTSLVKCCLKVDDSYKYKAPDIAASPEATYCVKNRFIGDIERYPSLKWIVIFGDSGWKAVTSIVYKSFHIKDYLESKGLIVLNYPHFAQNFQQRAIFALRPEQEDEYFAENPTHLKYAPTARRMRQAEFEVLAGRTQTPSRGIADDDELCRLEVSLNTKTKSFAQPAPNKLSEDDRYSRLFYLLHRSGDKLYPVKMRNQKNGKVAFRVSQGGAGGNTKEVGLEIEDEIEMAKYVLQLGYAVRAATLNRNRTGLFKIGQRSIVRAVEHT